VVLHPTDDVSTAAKLAQSKDAGPNAQQEALLAVWEARPPLKQAAHPFQMLSKASSPVQVAHQQLH